MCVCSGDKRWEEVEVVQNTVEGCGKTEFTVLLFLLLFFTVMRCIVLFVKEDVEFCVPECMIYICYVKCILYNVLYVLYPVNKICGKYYIVYSNSVG